MPLIQTLKRYWRLPAHCLRPEWPRMGLHRLIPCGAMAMEVVTPLLASCYVGGMSLPANGQAQRAAAARLLARAAELLVVDDLASALDIETERTLWGTCRPATT